MATFHDLVRAAREQASPEAAELLQMILDMHLGHPSECRAYGLQAPISVADGFSVELLEQIHEKASHWLDMSEHDPARSRGDPFGMADAPALAKLLEFLMQIINESDE